MRGREGGPGYSLDQWNEYRESIRQRVEQVTASYQQQAAQATQAGQPAPPPPQLPEVPPEIPVGFTMELMPELEAEKSYGDSVRVIEREYYHTLTFLKRLRRPKEKMWSDCEKAYNMAAELAFDENRRKSINLLTKDFGNEELRPERQSLLLPFAFEACQLLGSHLYMVMRGNGSNYVELVGVDPNDNVDAANLQTYMNFQYGHEIPTEDVYSDWVHDAIVLGSGVVMQTFDPKRQKRVMRVLKRNNVWWDKASSIQECSVINVRMEVSVGDLYKMRQNGEIWFEDADMESASASTVEHSEIDDGNTGDQPETSSLLSHQKPAKEVPANYQKAYLDIMMHTEPMPRWVYVVNERMVVGVKHPLIDADKTGEIEHRFPITVQAPIRRRGEIDGDSFVSRIQDVQDLSNAALELMTRNMKAASVGVGITLEEDMIGEEVKAGEWNRGDPSLSTINYPAQNSQAILGVIDWLMQRVSDRISGTTQEFRGKMQHAGMPATAVRDMLAQSAKRISPMEDRVLAAMQDSFETGILLNRLYLSPQKYFRVIGHVTPGNPSVGPAQDLSSLFTIIGQGGKDLVPAGFPGSQSDIAQKALNFAAVVMQTGGNPQPLMREAIKTEFRGRIDVSDVYPQDGVGANPWQENENIIAGKAVRRDPDDAMFDMMHISVHQLLLGDTRFRETVNVNPMAGMILQQHIATHYAAATQQAAVSTGAANGGGGMGSGTGTSGLNRQMIGPDPKVGNEIESQMGTINEQMG